MGQSVKLADDLTDEEQEIWASDFAEKITRASDAEVKAFETRKALGQGVGLSDDGTLVYQSSAKE